MARAKSRTIGTVNGKPVTWRSRATTYWPKHRVEFCYKGARFVNYLRPDGEEFDVNDKLWVGLNCKSDVLAVHALAVAAGLPGFHALPGEVAAKRAKRPGRDVCGKCCNDNPKNDPLHQLMKSPTMRLAECQKCARAALARVRRLEGRNSRMDKLCLAAQADKFRHRCQPGGPAMVDDLCPMCELEYEADLIANSAARIAKRARRAK